MASNKTIRNDKNLIRSQSEYSYVADGFGGADFSALDGKCDDCRLPYLVNMYCDRESRNSAALETVPGFRQLPKTAGAEGEAIFGMFAHTFAVGGESVQYVLVHKGTFLYAFRHDGRDAEETLSPIAKVAPARSCGFSYGGSFYLLDGENILLVSSPTEAVVQGDGAFTKEMAEAAQYPETNAYVPTVQLDGKPYEARNLLTGYYDVKRRLSQETKSDLHHGLKLRPIVYEGEQALEVYGLESGRREVFVPSEAEYGGVRLPIVRIAEGAFLGRDIVRAVLSPSVKLIGGEQGKNNGAFYGCTSLKEAVLYGVKEIGSEAFALCYGLERVVLGRSIETIGYNAFYGTAALRAVYCEGSYNTVEKSSFGGYVTLHYDTILSWKTVGDVLRIPCDPVAFSKIYTIFGAEDEALGKFSEYDGIENEETEFTTGYAVQMLSSTLLTGVYLKGADEQESYRYLFVTVTEPNGLLAYADAVESFRIVLPDYCQNVVSVTLDGEALPCDPADQVKTYYSLESGEKDGVSVFTALNLTLPYGEWEDCELAVRCYSSVSRYDPQTVPDYKAANPRYGGSSLDAIRQCRFAALFDGRIFLGGNPNLPDTVFYSVFSRDHRDAPAYFGATSFFVCRQSRGAISALLSHPSYLAVMKEEGSMSGGIYYCVPDGDCDLGHPLYKVAGGSGALGCVGASLHFRDDPVFLSRLGLFGIGAGNLWEEGRFEKRSYSIDRALPKGDVLSTAVLAEWKGYLVLLISGEIFLADSAATYQKNGVTQYEWYYLNDIGHYAGQTEVFRHMSVCPEVGGKKLTELTVDGAPLFILGKETECEGTVYKREAEEGGSPCGVTVYYTLLTDGAGQEKRFLVDSDGEMRGGVFHPATVLLSLGDILYFASSDGYLFCFNTDKRGVAAVIDGKVFPVEEDEIHNTWYTFNHRAYRSGFATAAADMGAPHVAKTTVRRSLVVKAKAMPHASFRVLVRTEKGGWEPVETVIASDSFSEDFSKESFMPEARQSITLPEHERRWMEKQLLFLSDGYRSPFGIDSVGYRYTVSRRIKL